MKARPDLERVVTDWLHDDATTHGSDRVLAGALVRVAGVGQERTPRLLRSFDMNTYLKLAIGVAAVAVIAVVGVNLLIPSSGVGGPAPAASPAASPSPLPSASPRPSVSTSPPPPAAPAFPPTGPLAVGTRHHMELEGVPFTFTVPTDDWISNGVFAIDKATGINPNGAGFIFWNDDANGVFANPCAGLKAPTVGPTAADMAAAIATIPGTDVVTPPTDVTVGGKPAKYVAIKVREDVGCQGGEGGFSLWYDDSDPSASRYATELGATYLVWIVEVDGKRVQIDGETFKGAGPEPGQQLQQIVGSIQFE